MWGFKPEPSKAHSGCLGDIAAEEIQASVASLALWGELHVALEEETYGG